MINKAISALAPEAQAQLMYSFNEGIQQFVILEGRLLGLPEKTYYVGCNVVQNQACFTPIQETGVWSFGIYKGCLCS